jgi:hypothetical protein
VSATERTAHGRAPDPDAELTVAMRELADRIETLQADVRRLGGPGLPAAEPGWIDEDAGAAITPSYAWVSSLGAPIRRRPAVPRLLLEVLFLAAVAIAAAVAKLDAGAIAAVMAVAWVLVALIEWAASRADRQRLAIPLFAPAAPTAAPVPLPADPSWFVPPVEHTLIEPAADSATAITKLPPPELDSTIDQPPSS